MSVEVLALFPTTVASFSLDREFTDSELGVFDRLLEDQVSNQGNSHTVSVSVLDEPDLADIKAFCERCVTTYGQEILHLNDGEPRIVSSWINEATPGQWHHQHHHRNALWSGVFYIATHPEDQLVFHRIDNWLGTFQLEATNYTLLNSETWWVPTRERQLILFPSTLLHSVPPTKHQRRRSLAFNAYPTQGMGSKANLTHIDLAR